MHDGTTMLLHKLAADYDPRDRVRAMNYLAERQAQGQVVTGLLYAESDAEDLHASLATVPTPLNRLGERELCPGAAALEKFNASLR
jgi:2-oxoglutarate ferredoxin oxidoreductase subunit beta